MNENNALRSEQAGRIGSALRAHRSTAQLTQAEFAERLGLSLEAYWRIERGRALPSAPPLAAIERQLGRSAHVLLQGELPTQVSRNRARRAQADVAAESGLQGSTADAQLVEIVEGWSRLPQRDRDLVAAMVRRLGSS